MEKVSLRVPGSPQKMTQSKIQGKAMSSEQLD